MSAAAEAPGLNEDFADMVRALQEEQAEFLLVGAHAMAVHGVPRATGDMDLLVRPSAANATRVVAALRRFGAPLAAHEVTAEDFARPDVVYQVGLPPRRIDILTSITGVSFDEAWATRVEVEVGGLRLPALGLDELLRNKRATGRPKDALDAEQLARRQSQRPPGP